MKGPLAYRPCAGIMLLNADGDVFVGQRIDSSLEAWQMPQGGIDTDEDPELAALRELREETGIAPHLATVITRTAGEHFYDLPPEMLGKLWGGRFRGQSQIWYLMRFLGVDSDINIETAEPEFRTWRWTPPHTLVDLVVPFKRDLYGNVLNEFSRHLK